MDTTNVQLHVLNNFQVVIPLAGDVDSFDFTQTSSPSIGLTLSRVNTTENYHYQIQMVQDDGVSERIISGGLAWAKRTPYQFQKQQNSLITEVLICRLKITTGTFDFRRVKHRSIRFVVRCFANNVLLSTGLSPPCRVLPKKRIAEEADDSTNGKA